MKTFIHIAKWALLAWGAASLIGLLALCAYVNYDLTAGNRSIRVTAPATDLRFVLNDCRLGDSRIESVLHSYRSARSFTGDHLDAHAIKVHSLSLADMQEPRTDTDGGWIRGDKLDPIYAEAVKLFVGFSLDEVAWFPPEETLLSDKIYVWIDRIVIHDRRPTAASIIFADPTNEIVYYGSVKF